MTHAHDDGIDGLEPLSEVLEELKICISQDSFDSSYHDCDVVFWVDVERQFNQWIEGSEQHAAWVFESLVNELENNGWDDKGDPAIYLGDAIHILSRYLKQPMSTESKFPALDAAHRRMRAAGCVMAQEQ